MQSFVVVVSQILFELAIDSGNIIGNFIQAFFLKGAIEPFDMRIIVGLADTGIAVFLFDLGYEPIPELRSMVTLEYVKAEGCVVLCL